MRLALAAVAVVPIVTARVDDAVHAHIANARQVFAASSPSSPVASSVASASVLLSTSAASPVTLSFSLLSTNPTAFPLASITGNAPSATTEPLASSPTAGAQPSSFPNAPPLPDIATLDPTKYPALDKVPPTDSPEVQQWIQEVQATGIEIPDFNATVAGGCPANLEAVQDTSRCWWTCGGCTRDTDITECPDARTWGLTYDDGPAFYTTQLLDYLDSVNLKSTFFVVGSRVISFPAILRSEHVKGHQIAVHTWSHPPLTTLSNEQIIAEFGWTKKVIYDVLGVTPNMMRPPFGDIDDRVRAIAMAMDLTPVMWTRISPTQTFDTDDFDINSGATTVQQVLSNWMGIMNNVSTRDSGFIVLEHDLFQQTVEVATGYILPDGMSRSLTIEPVYACLKMPIANVYIETNDNKTNPPPTGFGVNATSSATGGTSQSSTVKKFHFDSAAFVMSLAVVLAGFFTF